MANCHSNPQSSQNASIASVANSDENVGRMFECRICGSKFRSSQALGGHCASHNKKKSLNSGESSEESNIPAKPNSHACKLCGDEFSSGQALGGHMRKHRDVLPGNTKGSDDDEKKKKKMMTISAAVSSVTTEGGFENSGANNDCGKAKRKIVDDDEEDVELEVPITKKLNSNSCTIVRSLEVELELSLWWKKEQLEAYSDVVANQEQKKWRS